MDPEQVEALIAAVENRPSLYDKTSPDYSNRTHIHAEWENIAEEIGCTSEEARKRWKKLRDYFKRNHRDVTAHKPGSAASRKKRKWYLYDKLHFLVPFLTDRLNMITSNMISISYDDDGMEDDDDNMSHSSSSSFAVSCSRDSSTVPLVPDNNDTDIQENNYSLDNIPSTCNSRLQEKPRQHRPKLFPRYRTKQSDLESDLTKSEQHNLGEREAAREDICEDEYFFKSLIPKMKMMNVIDKMECEGEILMVVLKYVKKTHADAALNNQLESVKQSPPTASID